MFGLAKLRWFLLLLAALKAASVQGDAGEEKKLAKLENAWRDLEETVGQGKEKDVLAALRLLLPTKNDFEALFPTHHREMWAYHEKDMGDTKDVLREFRKLANRGPIIQINIRDARYVRSLILRYKPVFEIMPKNLPIVELSIRRGNDKMDVAGPFILLKERWVMIPDLTDYPKRLKAKKR